jgi:hypothetical protein
VECTRERQSRQRVECTRERQSRQRECKFEKDGRSGGGREAGGGGDQSFTSSARVRSGSEREEGESMG